MLKEPRQKPTLMPSLMDVEERQVMCCVTGGVCPRRCRGRQDTKNLITDPTNATAQIMIDIKTASPELAAEALTQRIAGVLHNIYNAGAKIEDVCANLLPKD